MMGAEADHFELSIHPRLLAGDPTASAELFENYQGKLVNALSKFLWQRDDSLTVDAATDALFEYIQNPSAYDPGKSRLFSYLFLAAKRDLINAVNRKATREKHEISTNVVEDGESDRNNMLEAVDRNAPDEPRQVRIMYGRELGLKLMEEISDPIDRAVLALMVENVRETDEYVSVLGITHLPAAEQRKKVKLHKDRINKQLERFGKRFRGKAN
jgi:DNA-directed RNA polymerase specialized sigma24 family protein